jgi:hypothetical protein
MPDYHQRTELPQILNELPLLTSYHSPHPPQRERPVLEINRIDSSLAIKTVNIETLEYIESLRLMIFAGKDVQQCDDADGSLPTYHALEKVDEVADVLWAIGCYQRAFNLSFQLLAAHMLLGAAAYNFVPTISKMSCSASTTEQLLMLGRTTKHLLDVPLWGTSRMKCALHVQLANVFRKLEQPAECAEHCLYALQMINWSSEYCGYGVRRGLISLIDECEEMISRYIDIDSAKQTRISKEVLSHLYEAKADSDRALRSLFKWCASLILDERLCAASALPAALEGLCTEDADFRTVARQTSIVVFGHIWEIFLAGSHRPPGMTEREFEHDLLLLRTDVEINESEIFAVMSLALMNLGTPFFASYRTVGGSYYPTSSWTTQNTHHLVSRIYEAAHALLSEERPHSDLVQRFFSARATMILSQVPNQGRTTKYVKSFLEGNLDMPGSLSSFIHQALENDGLPATSN